MFKAETSNSPADQPSRFVRLTFTQGVLVGQVSLIIVAILFIRYVIFEDPEAARNKRRPQRSRPSSTPTSRRRRSSLSERKAKPIVTELLSKLSYDLSTHPPETADWLNVLVAQAIVAYRSLVHGELDEDGDVSSKGEKAKQMVEEALNSAREGEPGIISVDYITVTEVDFGDRFPLLTNARVRPADETGRMRIEVDVDYSDHVTLAIETKVVINFPTSRFAVLPVALGLTLNQLSATIMAEIPPVAIPLPVDPDPVAEPAGPSPAILLSLDPDFTLCMSTSSLLGARAKLEDIPKVEQLILGRLRGYMVDNLVWPKVRVLTLPGVGSKGAVENAEDGGGEYVWVESEAVPIDEIPKPVSKPMSKLAPEADEDLPSPFSPTSMESLPPTSTGISPAPRSVRYRSNSVSSRPFSSRPSHHPDFITPPRLGRTERLEPHHLSPMKTQFPSDRSSSNNSSTKPRSTLRHSTSMIGNPTQLYREALANGEAKVHRQPHHRDDPERWAQAGGIWGLSLGLSHNGAVGGNGSPYGIRERVKEAERVRLTENLSSTQSS